MKRRHLLTLLPAASTLLATRSSAAPIPKPAVTTAGFAISVQCWSFREFSLFEAIEMSAAAGATAVEIFPGQRLGGPLGDQKLSPDLPDESIQQLLEHLKKNQIVPANLGVIDIPNNEDGARKVFEFAKKLNLYGVTTESIGSIDWLETYAKEYDLKVCFHNHPKPTPLWNPQTILDGIKGRHENLGFCADIGHWATSGLNPLEVIQNIAPRVHAFHMKDRASITEGTHDRPFGTGIIDLAAILDEVRSHGFAGNVSIEYEHNWKTSLPEIAQCAGYLRGYTATQAKA